MAELYPLPLSTLLKRIYREAARQGSIFDLPKDKWYRGDPALDTSTLFHGMRAGTPFGPAAGPQDQLVQNIVLAWLGGARIVELKTIQIMDELKIPRPCINATNIGFNVEFSQELKLEASLEEYVKASMVLQILDAEDVLEIGDRRRTQNPLVLDMSVGYDLAGISGPRVRGIIDQLMNAAPVIDRLRKDIPEEYAAYRDFNFNPHIANSITLSTFHGCPKDEIEKIVRYFIIELGVHSIIKLNPTQLGREKLEHLLHDVMGYTHLEVNPKAYTSGLALEEAVEIVNRLEPLARERGLGLGVKFSNTLETINKWEFFTDPVMYMSGPPLHVIATALVGEFRKLTGSRFPITFSAGIDNKNFANAVALGLAPITVCTDLLKPQGYGRASAYLTRFEEAMKKSGVANTPDFIIKSRGHGSAAVRTTVDRLKEFFTNNGALTPKIGEGLGSLAADLEADLAQPATNLAAVLDRHESLFEGQENFLAREWGGVALPASINTANPAATVHWALAREAALLNTPGIVEETAADPRYRYAQNSAAPKKIGSFLYLFDCISCDKCVPVCPNDANFIYDIEPVEQPYRDLVVTPKGVLPGEAGVFKVNRTHQIACYTDFCNECGNCDIFCPEDGGPFVQKPKLFGSHATWTKHRDKDGFFVSRENGADRVWGRIQGNEYYLEIHAGHQKAVFHDGRVQAEIDRETDKVISAATMAAAVPVGHVLSMKQYRQLDLIRTGVLNPSRVNFVNAAVR